MKRILGICILSVILSGSVFAGDYGHRGPDSTRWATQYDLASLLYDFFPDTMSMLGLRVEGSSRFKGVATYGATGTTATIGTNGKITSPDTMVSTKGFRTEGASRLKGAVSIGETGTTFDVATDGAVTSNGSITLYRNISSSSDGLYMYSPAASAVTKQRPSPRIRYRTSAYDSGASANRFHYFTSEAWGRAGGVVTAAPSAATTRYGWWFSTDGTNFTEVMTLYGDGDLVIDGNFNYFLDTTVVGDAYDIVCTCLAAYKDGLQITFKAGTANVGACTLRINGLADVAIKTTGGDDPPDDYIEAGSRVSVIFCDESTDYWQLLSPDANP
jgi:hypothetical protein